MYYEFNISLKGKHLFATAERSATTMTDVSNLLKIFLEKFPKEEGYEIMLTRWEKTGKILDIETIAKSLD